MFKQIFTKLCADRNLDPTVVCKNIGISKSNYSNWNDSSVPRATTLQKLADYFGVSVDYLLGKEEQQKENAPTEDNLSEGERMLLELFRQIPEEKQQMALQMLRAALLEK